ncbi:MAG TPA: 50S ribosomal protein L30e [Candidatus Norongarragalinales archaeon]|nr:50S ribosomal protein L30e [Candidatus Norongarragalinales archaeon]
MDLGKAIRQAVDTGKVELGSKKARKLALIGGAKLIILANNMPKDTLRDIEHYSKLSNVPILEYKGTSIELGTICGKPFTVSVLSIIEEGHSEILKALDGEKK